MFTRKYRENPTHTTVRKKRLSKIKNKTVTSKQYRKKINKTRRGGAMLATKAVTKVAPKVASAVNSSRADQKFEKSIRKKIKDSNWFKLYKSPLSSRKSNDLRKRSEKLKERKKRIREMLKNDGIPDRLVNNTINKMINDGELPQEARDIFDETEPSSSSSSSLPSSSTSSPSSLKSEKDSDVNMSEQLTEISQLIDKMNGVSGNSKGNPGAKYADCPGGAREIIIKITTTTDGNCVQAEGIAGLEPSEKKQYQEGGQKEPTIPKPDPKNPTDPKTPETEPVLKKGNMARYIDQKRSKGFNDLFIDETQKTEFKGGDITDMLHKRVTEDINSFLSGFNNDETALKNKLKVHLKSLKEKKSESKVNLHNIPFDLYYELKPLSTDTFRLSQKYKLDTINKMIHEYVDKMNLDIQSLNVDDVKKLYDTMNVPGDNNVRNIVCNIQASDIETKDVKIEQNRLFSLNEKGTSVYCYLLRKMYDIKFEDDITDFNKSNENYKQKQLNSKDELNYNTTITLANMEKDDPYNFTMIVMLLSKYINNTPIVSDVKEILDKNQTGKIDRENNVLKKTLKTNSEEAKRALNETLSKKLKEVKQQSKINTVKT
jgi:hypothetical protein